MYGYQATENSNARDSEPRNGKYSKIKTISLPSNLSNLSAISWKVARLSLSIEEGTSEVFLAIHDQGACLVLYSFLVTYNVCPGKVLPGSLILLPETVAPTNESDTVEIMGKCVDNSESTSSDLGAVCETSGEWLQGARSKGACLCKPGWENAINKCQGTIMQYRCACYPLHSSRIFVYLPVAMG